MHGGGLLLGCKKHILADKLNLVKYDTVGRAEMVCVEWEGVHWVLYYTPNAHEALLMIQVIQQYKEDHPGVPVVFIGDTNVHNSNWICSTSTTDQGGILAQEFSEIFGMTQLVNFPTRKGNTLDLVLSDINGAATVSPGVGNSDHESMYLTFKVGAVVPKTPVKHSVLDWHSAPVLGLTSKEPSRGRSPIGSRMALWMRQNVNGMKFLSASYRNTSNGRNLAHLESWTNTLVE